MGKTTLFRKLRGEEDTESDEDLSNSLDLNPDQVTDTQLKVKQQP